MADNNNQGLAELVVDESENFTEPESFATSTQIKTCFPSCILYEWELRRCSRGYTSAEGKCMFGYNL